MADVVHMNADEEEIPRTLFVGDEVSGVEETLLDKYVEEWAKRKCVITFVVTPSKEWFYKIGEGIIEPNHTCD